MPVRASEVFFVMSTPIPIQDLRFACKVLISTPGSAVLAILSLAISIAACTTIFSVIYTVLLSGTEFQESKSPGSRLGVQSGPRHCEIASCTSTRPQ